MDARRRHAQLMARLGIADNWTPIAYNTRIIRRTSANDTQGVSRQQFPLTPAEAITVHKSQEGTYGTVVVHLPARAMPRSLIYVACSKATSATGLYLIGTFRAPSPPKPTNPLSVELRRHTTARLRPVFSFLHEDRDLATRQLMFHNVQSLHAYIDVV